jgi:1-aminocyclopropane-1-carboxylate deaminase/D-cysteine desulfhydrase-like pyridoxal-dependent ACC family enzyme
MLLQLPTETIPIQEILIHKNIKLFLKREDLIHPQISGNKYWKLFYNVNNYLGKILRNLISLLLEGHFPIILLRFLQ